MPGIYSYGSRVVEAHRKATSRGVRAFVARQPKCPDCKAKRLMPTRTFINGRYMKIRPMFCSACKRARLAAGTLPTPDYRRLPSGR